MTADTDLTLSPAGNVFVIAAIVMEKGLQNVANYLIVSLAVADLMVACLVMPLGAMYEVSDSECFTTCDERNRDSGTAVIKGWCMHHVSLERLESLK